MHFGLERTCMSYSLTTSAVTRELGNIAKQDYRIRKERARQEKESNITNEKNKYCKGESNKRVEMEYVRTRDAISMYGATRLPYPLIIQSYNDS